MGASWSALNFRLTGVTPCGPGAFSCSFWIPGARHLLLSAVQVRRSGGMQELWMVFFQTCNRTHSNRLPVVDSLQCLRMHVLLPRDFPVDSASRSDLISWKIVRGNVLSGMVSFSQVSVKHREAEFENSLFVRESRRSSSILLGRERRFARWMLGNAVLNPRWRSFTSAPARF